MPKNRPSRPPQSGPLLKSWRQEGPSGGKAKAWLIVRRATATLIALALVGGLAWIVLRPFFLPKTYLSFVAADDLAPLAAPPLKFVYEDLSGFARLQASLTPLSDDAPPLPFTRLARPELLEAELQAVAEAEVGPEDAVVLYIAAHGIVLDREDGPRAYLICSNFSPASPASQIEQGLYPVDKLLRQIRDLPGGPKLLLLDAGQLETAPRAGMAINLFPEMLQQAMNDLEQPVAQLWVLTANSPGERSHVSTALRRSVFGFLAAAGLQGAADLNDDGEVQLRELADYVRQNVARWVQQASGDRASQTPLLLGPARNEVAGEVHLLYTAGLPDVPSVSAEINAAHSKDSRKSVLSNVADFMSQRVDEFAVGPASDAFDFLASGVEEDEETPSSDSAEDTDPSGGVADRDAARRLAEYGLVERAWELTAKLAGGPNPPYEYAPHLWRLHLDQLLWYEQLQQSGERLDPRILVEALRELNQSLEAFGQPDKPLRGAPRNVIEQIRLRRPTPPLTLAEAPTLALAEAVAAADPQQSMPEKLVAFVDPYDRWLNSGDGYERLAALVQQSWGDPAWQASWQQFYEFLPIDRYLDRPELPVELVKLSLAVRREGEQAAARPYWGEGWAAGIVQRADRRRLEAERLLIDQAASDWQRRVEENLQAARRLYAEANAELDEVQQAADLYQRMLSVATDYLRWRRRAAGQSAASAPSEQRLRDFLAVLDQLAGVLDRPEEARLADLRSYANRLERIRDDLAGTHQSRIVEELSAAPYRSNVPPRIDAMLTTALLDAPERSRLITARVAAEQELMRDFQPARPSASALEPPSPRASRQAAASHLELWRSLLKRFDPRRGETNSDNVTPDVDDPQSIVRQNRLLREQLATLPEAIAAVAASNRALADTEQRAGQLERLRRARGALFLVDPVDLTAASPLAAVTTVSSSGGGEQTTSAGPLTSLHHAAWYDTLRQGQQRRQTAVADAPAGEATVLRSQARSLADLAARIEGQPPIKSATPSTLRLNVTQQEVPLVTSDETLVNLTVSSQRETPIWIVAQYDEQLLEVDGVGGVQIVRENQMPAPPPSVDAEEAAYPYHPQVRQIADSLQAAPRQPREVAVRVRRRSAAGGRATLVLKAVSQSEHVRQTLPVRLPVRRDLQLSVVDERGQETAVGRSVNLFARHIQDLTLQITNQGGAQRTLRGALYAPQRRSTVEIPDGWIEPLAAEQILRRFGRRVPVATGAALIVPPGASRPLVFDFGSTDNRSALGAQTEGAPPRIPLPHGMLLQLVDEQSGQSTIWPLRFEVWKPRRFLSARAFYDPGSQELRVTLAPIDDNRLPAAPVKAELVMDPQYVSDVGRRAMTVEITGPGQRGELRSPLKGFWPAQGYLAADIAVDGYPRAFRFRVNPATAGQDLYPEEDITQIEIAHPEPGAEFPASAQVPVELHVDAPEGFFSVETSWIDIGIDVDRDREFENETPRRLRSDRHVEIFARVPEGEETTLALEPVVGDFQLSMNTEGLNGRVNVLCQVQSDGEIEEEQDIEIVLDGDGPTFAPFKFNVRDGELVAEIYPQDELTRVESVEAGLESLDTEEIKWEKAKQADTASDQWIARLSLKELAPGEHNVHFRAVDSAGNQSLVKREVMVEQPSTPPADSSDAGSEPADSKPAKPVENRLAGVVTYGRHDISELVVSLAGQDKTAKISAGGRFDFGMLPPGDYTIQARGLSRGNYRKGEKKVTVSDKPNTPARVQMKIR